MKSDKWIPTKHELDIAKTFAKSIREFEEDDEDFVTTKREAGNFGLTMAFLFHIARTGNDHGFLEFLNKKSKKKKST